MTSPTIWGPEFLLNTTILNSQYSPSLQLLKDGSFVGVWSDSSETGGDKDGAAIRGQIFNADGTKRGGEFLINSSTAGEQSNPVVTVLNDGHFVVAWGDHGSGDVRARVFQANGTPLGSDFKVGSGNISYTDTAPAITALANGGFAVSYADDSGNVLSQAFGASMQPVGGETLVNTSTSATLNWVGSSVSLQGQYLTFFYDIDNYTIHGRFVNNDGTIPAGSADFAVSGAGAESFYPVSAKLSDGRIVVAWTSATTINGSDNRSIKAQILNPDGSKSGGEFLVSAAGLKNSTDPVVTATADGGFTIAYSGALDHVNSSELRVAAFDSHGARTGTDLVIEKVYEAWAKAITTLADGRVVVSWENWVSDLDNQGAGLHTQIVDPRQKAVDLAGTSFDDKYFGTHFNDRLNGAEGNDQLSGGEGSDTLTGGAGSDVFIFDTALSKGRTKNVDTITDFDGNSDRIYLDNAIFTGLGKKGSPDSPLKLSKKPSGLGIRRMTRTTGSFSRRRANCSMTRMEAARGLPS